MRQLVAEFLYLLVSTWAILTPSVVISRLRKINFDNKQICKSPYHICRHILLHVISDKSFSKILQEFKNNQIFRTKG